MNIPRATLNQQRERVAMPQVDIPYASQKF